MFSKSCVLMRNAILEKVFLYSVDSCEILSKDTLSDKYETTGIILVEKLLSLFISSMQKSG